MRHRSDGWKPGKDTGQQKALLRNLVTKIILADRVETTMMKAKAARPIIEKIITLAREGTVHTRRQAAAYMTTPEGVDRLFQVVAPRYATHSGSYLRITRVGARGGDAAEMAVIELVVGTQNLHEQGLAAHLPGDDESQELFEEPAGEAPEDEDEGGTDDGGYNISG